jgi:acetyl-CoA acyltransferase 1
LLISPPPPYVILLQANRGAFKDTSQDILLGSVLKGLIDRSKIDPSIIGDICVGNVGGTNFSMTARVAQMYSGIPFTVPLYSVNRQCSSGIEAVASIARSISSGLIDVGIACGAEAMTEEDPNWRPRLAYDNIYAHDDGSNVMSRMGDTSDRGNSD